MPKSKKPPSSETLSPETKPAPPNGPDKDFVGLTPWTVLQAAVKAVPPLKYALGVLGIVSAIAIIKGFGIDFRVAVFGTIIMVVLMAALVIFAALTKVKSPQVRAAALVMMWSFLALTILSAALLFTSAFFGYPKPLTQLIGYVDHVPGTKPAGYRLAFVPPDAWLPPFARANVNELAMAEFARLRSEFEQKTQGKTSIQRPSFFDQYVGQRFTWVGYVSDVWEERYEDRYYCVTIRADSKQKYGFSARSYFVGEPYEEMVKALQPDQEIRVTGVMNKHGELTSCKFVNIPGGSR